MPFGCVDETPATDDPLMFGIPQDMSSATETENQCSRRVENKPWSLELGAARGPVSSGQAVEQVGRG